MKKPKRPKFVKKLKERNKPPIETGQPVARITNETVAEEREQVIGKARKFIYPLQHSKHKIVTISVSIFVLALVAFTAYCTIALYRLKDSSTFLYKVTQVIPFPVARVGKDFIAYENYLFDLRRYIHYYETQGKLNFSDPKNKEQLDQYKKQALNKVITDAYVKKIAEEKGISVSNQELDNQIAIVRNQNRLGSNDQVFEDVLKDFWGWSVSDFKRSLRQEMLAQKVVAKLDTETQEKAKKALAELKGGADFAEVAKKYSDDEVTKPNGGEFGFSIDKANKEVSAQAVEALFQVKPGQISDVINTGYELVILKNIETNGDKVRAAQIVFRFKDINSYVNDIKENQPAKSYVSM